MDRDGAEGGAGCSRIEAGVQRTLAEGSGEVEVVLEYSFPSEAGKSGEGPEARSTRYRGVVDFRSDRVSLASGNTVLLLEGAAAYQRMPDGVWTHTQGGLPGQWTCTHPRWALEILRQGCRSAEQEGQPDVTVELDRDRAAGLTHPGLNPDWRLRAGTAFDDAGRLRRIEVTMAGSASPDAWMRSTVEFIRFDQDSAQIDLPKDSVALSTYLGQASG
jgi:hypothetical protein